MIKALLLTAFAGSCVGIVLLLLKNKLLKLIGGRFLYAASLLAMLLFVIPLSLPQGFHNSPKPKAQLVQQNADDEKTLQTEEVQKTTPAFAETEDATPQRDRLPSESAHYARKAHPITVSELLFLLWFVGFSATLLRYAISYRRFRKKVCVSYTGEKSGKLRFVRSSFVSSPMLLGFFKPTLVLPQKEMTPEEYELALRHEMIHYKRHDAWLKLGAVMINAIHWFHPVPYFLLNLIGEACEYACDETLTREMTLGERRQYSEMILNLVCQSSPALSSNMAKNKKQLYRRFEMIMTKKKCNLGIVAVCLCLLLSLFCGTAALANEALPALSTVLLDDYVYVEAHSGTKRFVPVLKNGEYFLPLREVLNACGIENDKIVYDLSDSSITVDIWTKELKSVSIIIGDENRNREEEVVRTAHPSWKTSLLIGSKEVDIGGQKHSLRAAPYKDNGITYVPYEYFKLLQSYENTENNKKDSDMETNCFSILQMYGRNALNNEYFCDYVSLESLAAESKNVFLLHSENSSAKISKTGFRTEFELQTDYRDLNDAEQHGNITITLNRVTRIFSKGSDIEGLFTVTMDGKTVYENEKGYLNDLPTPAGEGTPHFDVTTVSVGDFLAKAWFRGWMGFGEEEYSLKCERNSHLRQSPDASYRLLVPEEVKLNGHTVSHAGNNNFVWKNGEYGGCNFDFYDSDGTYHIDNLEETEIVSLDENSFSLHCYFSDNHCRNDSFEAIITLLPNDRFEFCSADGNYIIRGSTKAYTYLWERSPEEKTTIAVEMTQE